MECRLWVEAQVTVLYELRRHVWAFTNGNGVVYNEWVVGSLLGVLMGLGWVREFGMGMVEGENFTGLDIVNGRPEAFVSLVQLGGSQPGLHLADRLFMDIQRIVHHGYAESILGKKSHCLFRESASIKLYKPRDFTRMSFKQPPFPCFPKLS